MFIKNIITSEKAHYLVIDYPLKHFQKTWENAEVRIFKYWDHLSYVQFIRNNIPVIVMTYL